MSNDVEVPAAQSTVSLLTDILGDLQRLVEQQFLLTRREIEQELRERMSAAITFVSGVGLLLVAAIMACLMLVHLMHWAGSPPGSDPGWLPLWGCYGTVAIAFSLTGAILFQVGWTNFKAVKSFKNPITEILQEPGQWTNQPTNQPT